MSIAHETRRFIARPPQDKVTGDPPGCKKKRMPILMWRIVTEVPKAVWVTVLRETSSRACRLPTGPAHPGEGDPRSARY